MTIQALRQLRRALSGVMPGIDAGGAAAPTLDVASLPQEPPRTRACVVVEGERLEARVPDGAPVAGFAAFLDGTQRSEVVAYDEGTPIVLGSVAAVVRTRVDRRMVTWGSGAVVSERLYVPAARLRSAVRDALEASGVPVVDTLAAGDDGAHHPVELVRRAIRCVENDREALERTLAERWCLTESRPLFVDGGFPLRDAAPGATTCIGVIKSHHTLYVEEGSVAAVLSLPEGTRSSVFRVERTWGPTVLSWYLRLRRAPARDPLWGLVRVEVIPEDPDASDLTSRADRISQWIFAERNPLSLPDGRWDRMVYGVRDVEEYLRAVRE